MRKTNNCLSKGELANLAGVSGINSRAGLYKTSTLKKKKKTLIIIKHKI